MKFSRCFGAIFSVLLLVASAALSPVRAQAKFPTKTVEIIVWVTAGGSQDLAARTLARVLEQRWKVPVRVVNKPGGNTLPAIGEVMNARPDGHTVILESAGSTSLLPIVVPDAPYKHSERAFLGLLGTSPMIFAVASSSRFQSLKDVADTFKAGPNSISWTAIGGVGTIDILFRKLFREIDVPFAKTRLVPVKGGSDAAVQTAGGHIDIGAGSYQSLSPFIPNKRLRLLAVGAPKRQSIVPDVPTTVEAGYKGVFADSWMGLSTTPNTPHEVVKEWEAAIRDAQSDPGLIESFKKLSVEMLIGGAAEMRKYVDDETADMLQLYGKR